MTSTRLKRLLREADDRAGDAADRLPLLSVSISTGVSRRAERAKDAPRAEDLRNYKVCLPGDLVVNRMRAFQGALGLAPENGIVSPDYSVLRAVEPVNLRWLETTMRSQQFVSEMTRLVRGIGGTATGVVRTPRLNVRDLLGLAIDVPSIDQQNAIADYLDSETGDIDELIAEQERLITLLGERRTALVANTLLTGLDSTVQRAPSGDPVLGDIPAHWTLVPTRHLATITTGSEDSGNATDDGAYPFYVRGREILRIDRYSFDCEAVMTPGDGQGGTGKVFHYVAGKFEAHQRVYIFKDFRGIDGWYFYYYLSSFLGPVALAGSSTVTMESLRRPLLADFAVAVPPLDEQRRITAFLDAQTGKVDQLITEAERLIELSRERRVALITAAVTGQIHVPSVA